LRALRKISWRYITLRCTLRQWPLHKFKDEGVVKDILPAVRLWLHPRDPSIRALRHGVPAGALAEYLGDAGEYTISYYPFFIIFIFIPANARCLSSGHLFLPGAVGLCFSDNRLP